MIPGYASRAGREILRKMDHWLEIPIYPTRGWSVTTWGALVERYDRCLGRLAFYVGRRVCDPASCERIVIEVLQRNLDLLVCQHDELGEVRSLKESADHLIRTILAPPAGSGSLRL